MKDLSCNKFCRACDKLAMILLYLLMADCAMLGSGRIISVGPLGLRMILLGLLLAASLPLIVCQFSRLVKNRLLWFLAAFALWLIIEAVVGIARGNSLSLLASDLKGFAYFVAVIPALCVLNSKQRIHRLMKVIMYASSILATFSLILLFLYNTNGQLFGKIVALDPEHQITMFAAVSDRIPRLFFKSTPYFLCGCAFPFYFAVTEKTTLRFWLYPMIVGLSLFAMLVSYTRSIYLGVGVAAIFMVLVFWIALGTAGRKQLAKVFGTSVAICLLLTALCSVTMKADYFRYALDRVGITFYSLPDDPGITDPSQSDPSDPSDPADMDFFQQATVESDTLRAQTMDELVQNILRSPVWGHGLGKALEVRNGYANEYIYHDILMKTGVIGLLLFLAPAILLFADFIKKLKNKSDSTQMVAPWLTVLLGFMIFSYFNPYMNASLGILFYCCSIGVVSVSHQPNNHIQQEN